MHILSILTVSSSLAIAGVLPSPSLSPPSCKAFPGTPTWPTIESWSALNNTLGGRLLRPALPGGVCHPEQPNFDEALCDEIGGEGGLWTTYDWHTTDPLSVQWDNWS